jgi:hypothetical protein
LVCYDAATGLPRAAAASEKKSSQTQPMTPVIKSLEPRGVQRGVETKVKLHGTNLVGVNKVEFADPRLSGEMLVEESADEVLLALHTPSDLPRGNYDFKVLNKAGQSSGIVKIVVDDLPQLYAAEKSNIVIDRFPTSIWGALEKPGVTDRLEFQAKAGQTLVFDLASKSLGAKGDAVLSLTDGIGHVLASNNDYDGSGDPLVAYTFTKDGSYAVIVSDVEFGGSSEHFYRLSAGEFPFVTGFFPLSLPANAETDVELVGFNLPAEHKIRVKSGAVGELQVPVDGEKLRSRRVFKLLVSELPHAIEAEPNDTPEQANALIVPGSINGRLMNGPQPFTADVDHYRFEARKDSRWVIETQAAQRGSPADTKIAVLRSGGRPVERLLLQAVRDSAITFRGIDSVTNDVRVENWREMDLNQLMFVNGEVAKIFRMPEGPDSGFQLYSINGKRQVYFDTTATAHALDEPCYIVEPHPPGTKLISNGLPSFPMFYANDDDGERQIGTDSRLLFTAPADGAYVVRVSDSRGLSGDRYAYRLVVREAQPDFSINISLASPVVNRGSGQDFTVTADRKDGFDGEIGVDITGVPDGFKIAAPLLIEAGHQAAKGSLFALGKAASQPGEHLWSELKVTAQATIQDKKVTRIAPGFGNVQTGEPPKVYVALEPAAPGDTVEHLSAPVPLQEQDPAKPFEITIAPGESIPAWIKVKRNGEDAELRFDVENLPHGIIVDNLGLNGITLLAGQNEGEITIKAARWVREMDRLCYAVTREAGKQTSLPVLLHVRKKDAVKSLEVK